MQDQQDGVQELGPVAADMGSGVLNAEKGEKSVLDPYSNDPFGNEEFAEIKYRTMSWWYDSHAPFHFLPLLGYRGYETSVAN